MSTCGQVLCLPEWFWDKVKSFPHLVHSIFPFLWEPINVASIPESWYCGFSILLLSITKVLAESMTITIALDTDTIHNLDLSPALTVIDQLLQEGAASHEQQLCFDINYSLEPGDPREFSEIPELRLWFVRLDAKYPWLPFLLDWKSGEFARYTAMLVPHQFSTKEGIQYNPEALEIFLMHKIFILGDWLQQQGIPSQSRLKSMAQMLGYELDDGFFEIFS